MFTSASCNEPGGSASPGAKATTSTSSASATSRHIPASSSSGGGGGSSSSGTGYPHLSSYYGQYAADPYSHHSAAGIAHAHAQAAHAAHAHAAHYPTSMDMAASWYAATTNNSLGHLYRGYEMDGWSAAHGGNGVDPLVTSAGSADYNVAAASRLADPLQQQHQQQQQQHGSPLTQEPQDIKGNLFREDVDPQHNLLLGGPSSHHLQSQSQQSSSSQPQHSSPDSGLATSENGSPNDLPPALTMSHLQPPGLGDSSPRHNSSSVNDLLLSPSASAVRPPRPPSSASSSPRLGAPNPNYSWLDKRGLPVGGVGVGGSSGRAAPKEGGFMKQQASTEEQDDTEEDFSRTRTKDKYRVVYSDHQRLELEKEFHFSRYITIRRKAELAQALSLSERQVKIWFQNRRAKERKHLKKRDDLIHKEKLDVGNAAVSLHHAAAAAASQGQHPPPHMFAMPMLHHGMAAAVHHL